MKNQQSGGGQRTNTEQARQAAASAKDEIRDTMSDAADSARDMGENLVDEGREKLHQAGDMVRSRADDQMDRVAEGARTIADVLRSGSDDLPEDRRQYRSLLNSAADQAEGVSRYFESHDVSDVTRDVRRFARDNTPLFLGGAFALGLFAARFLKASDDVSHDRGMGASYEPGSGYDRDHYGATQQRFDRMLPEQGSRARGAPTGGAPTGGAPTGGMDRGNVGGAGGMGGAGGGRDA